MSKLKPIGAVVALAALVYFMVFHWGRFLSDFWPFDSSRVGPNLVASVVQWALIAILVALLYPPARRAIEKFAQRHVESIKDHVSAEHAKIHDRLDRSHERQDQLIAHMESLHAKVDAQAKPPTKKAAKTTP